MPVFNPDNPQEHTMRLTPMSESAIAEAGLLAAGEYSFTVSSAKESTSKKGNAMIVVELEVYDDHGKSRKITDYLMESVAYKLRHFAFCAGLGSQYEAGELNAIDMPGKSGKLIIRIEPEKDGFAAKNSVKDYCKSDQSQSNAPSPKRPASPSADDSESPPF